MTGKKWWEKNWFIRNLSTESRHVLIEILVGIMLYFVIGAIILLFVPVDTLPAVLGLLLGVILNFASMIHIAYVTEVVVNMRNRKEASQYSIVRYLIRLLIMGAVIVLAFFTKYLNMLTLVIGLFGIKMGAYLQPYTHRILERYVYGR